MPLGRTSSGLRIQNRVWQCHVIPVTGTEDEAEKVRGFFRYIDRFMNQKQEQKNGETERRGFLFCKRKSLCLQGINCVVVSVEADVSDGLPGCLLVGYLASEVREAQERVRTAIRNLGIRLPPKKITINLSPADIRKEGTGFDLAIAAAILTAYGCIPEKAGSEYAFAGELGLDGTVKGIPGILAMADAARKSGIPGMFLPKENAAEASVIRGLKLVPVASLGEMAGILSGRVAVSASEEASGNGISGELNRYDVDFSEVNGQLLLRRAAEVAAAGKHNLLMIGPAGSGKTMVARRIPTIMPELTVDEAIEISKLYSISHLLSDRDPILRKRPFRAPHHSVSVQALTGGGARPKPGEISLASGGILFLDELPEMPRQTLEALRQPLEERCVTISRVYGTVCYPADFQLVAAMNPCLCGYFPDRQKCRCTPSQIRRYLGKLSRPILDRIDICVEASLASYQDVSGKEENESSESIRRRVRQAREIQAHRFRESTIRCNGEMTGKQVRQFCSLGTEESCFMEKIFEEMGLSARMYDKILKVARTAADLENSSKIERKHLSEAVSYVRFKEKYWGR